MLKPVYGGEATPLGVSLSLHLETGFWLLTSVYLRLAGL